MATALGFEPRTNGVEDRRSIQLSYAAGPLSVIHLAQPDVGGAAGREGLLRRARFSHVCQRPPDARDEAFTFRVVRQRVYVAEAAFAGNVGVRGFLHLSGLSLRFRM